jgi:hypothetical protein
MVLILKCEMHDNCTVYHDVHRGKGKPAPIDEDAVERLRQGIEPRLLKVGDALSELFARVQALEEGAK